ncbi:C-type lectin domain family 1 member A-like [Heterocephalus glaber]|uniref:C-type lectin domain family 1 member A-like n=1 Tax=Heterocephalus glaber TaxID=10181 RepID=A0AAX6QU49_HETGA|nr:C-type lectin domain family 1 member A-like [Heterocephalus glaber]
MREEGVTYSELKIQAPSQLPRRVPELAKPQGNICLEHLVAERNSGNLTCNQETGPQISGDSKSQQSLTNVQAWKCHPCDDSWHHHGSNCYCFSKSLTPWRDCELRCATFLSKFLRLNVEEELDFVKKNIKNAMLHALKKFWISLYDNSSQSKWT